jgi:glutamine amidotransferase
MKVLVVDYGMGNLGSISRSLEECGASVSVSDDPREIAAATHVVLPGVGSFADGMANLRARGLEEPLRKAAAEDRVPLLGICLGMQMLASSGKEGGDTEGLGFIPGEVVPLVPAVEGERIPHVGWNEVHPRRPSPLFEGIAAGTDFYFVHSYRFAPAEGESALAVTPYCGGFVSAVSRENVAGVQFHPEKSGRPGFALLRNFLRS